MLDLQFSEQLVQRLAADLQLVLVADRVDVGISSLMMTLSTGALPSFESQ